MAVNLGNVDWFDKGAATRSASPLADEAMALAIEGLCAALNKAATMLYDQSQVEVPKSIRERDRLRHPLSLAESGRYPGNDPELAAIPGKLYAEVTYGSVDVPYAATIHEGQAVFERESGPVEWQVENWSTEGTKDHYLSDPLKAITAELPALVAAEVNVRLEGLNASIAVA